MRRFVEELKKMRRRRRREKGVMAWCRRKTKAGWLMIMRERTGG